ncbi:hypothetical protein LOTGIDRAFT_237644 [Lottia gigantea]|uniref:Nose resistant-to-fluoxetine protein N-terminal domain-containing protein n=1 Tax=Lottia gigantea TaxID=225164 RepID=V4CMG1_LOTGI|nr:hypothetical protein LOTGIDRAFT_237644 [Lottia gigantea]ESP03530.1 hypothetical protein LOTGIDRAFT_237644 [Lottia gigantea]
MAKITYMVLVGLLFLSTTLAADGTDIGANYNNSNTKKEYSQLEKGRLVGQALLDNDHVFRELEAIFYAYADFKKTQPPSQVGGLFSEGVLGMMPKLLRSSDFQDIARIITDEVGRVNTSKVMEMAKANHWQPNNPNVTNALLYTYQHNLNYKRLIQRIMMRRSTRIYFPYFESLMSNKQCYEDSMDFMDALVGGQYPTDDPNDFNFTTFWWALKMFDSIGKPSGGITKGALYYIGSYDECAKVQAYIPKNITLGHIWRGKEKSFTTKFCRAKFNVSDNFVQSLNVDTRGLKLLLNWGLCVPASCHGDDIVKLINMGPLPLPVNSVSCHEEPILEDDSSAIAAIVILSIFGAIVVVCSFTEGILSSLPLPRQTGHGHINRGFFSDESTIIKNGYAPKSLDVQLTSYDEKSPNGNGIYENVNNGSIIKSNGVSKAEEAGTSNGAVHHFTKPEPPEPPTDKPRKISPFIKAFSILTNVPKLLSAKKSPSAINCIHGIRFISMLWILLGHTYNYGVISDAENPTTANLVDAASLFERFTFQGIMAAGFGVDTFFLLSGFLVTYLTLKDLGKKKVKGGYMFMYYFHRFWRLTPLYMIVLMTFSCLYAYMGEGPLWPETIPAADYCKTNWWTNLLYVNNLVRAKEQCLGWSWYLANDMQFYVFSPIFIFLIFWYAPVGIALTVGVGVAGVASAFYAHYETGGDMFSMHEIPDYWYDVYIVPWTRMAAWMVGILLGFIMYKTDKIKQLKMKIAVFGWLITLFVGFFLAYITYTFRKEDGEPWPQWVQSLYESLGRPVFAACVAWVIFACHRKRGGLINDVLSWNGIIPLSRLTYACYLLHPTVMMIKVFNQRHLIYISDFDVAYLYIGHTVMTFMVAFIFSVVFEAPFLSLEKILFHKGR